MAPDHGGGGRVGEYRRGVMDDLGGCERSAEAWGSQS